MQHGGMFVQRHNVAVWNIGIAVYVAVGTRVDVKLAHAGTEGLRAMTAHRHFSALRAYRPVHNPFYRRGSMQVVDNTFRVDVAGGDIQCSARSGTGPYSRCATRGGQLAADAIHAFGRRRPRLLLSEGRWQRFNVILIDRQIKPQFGVC